MGVFDAFRAIRHAKQMVKKLREAKTVDETDFLCLWFSGPELCHCEENVHPNCSLSLPKPSSH